MDSRCVLRGGRRDGEGVGSQLLSFEEEHSHMVPSCNASLTPSFHGFQSAPEPEDLHIAMLEDGLAAPVRRVLDAMAPEPMAGGSGGSGDLELVRDMHRG